MIFTVISPVHGQTGNTTVALTLVHALALTQRKQVCLTHVNFGSPAILSALGVEPSTDITRSLSHVAKMLTNNLLSADEVPDYAIKIFSGLDVYSTHQVEMDEHESFSFFGNLITNMSAYHHTVIDIDNDIDSLTTHKALGTSDIIIIPITQNHLVIKEALSFKRKIRAILEDQKGKKRSNATSIYFVVNHYRPTLMPVGRIAKRLGVAKKNVLTLEYNPSFPMASNSGKLTDIFASAINSDNKVLKIKFDMKRMCKALLVKDFIWDIDKKKSKSTADEIAEEGLD